MRRGRVWWVGRREGSEGRRGRNDAMNGSWEDERAGGENIKSIDARRQLPSGGNVKIFWKKWRRKI